ncbi:hypothetical protein ACWDRB_27575 [Nonomuraea sp. NPDC003707]
MTAPTSLAAFPVPLDWMAAGAPAFAYDEAARARLRAESQAATGHPDWAW